MAEWLKAAVLKTVRVERLSGVRIPLPPPAYLVDFVGCVRADCTVASLRLQIGSCVMFTCATTPRDCTQDLFSAVAARSMQSC